MPIFPFLMEQRCWRGKVLDIQKTSMTAPNLKGMHWKVLPNHGIDINHPYWSLFSPLWIYILPQIPPENYISGRKQLPHTRAQMGQKKKRPRKTKNESS